MLSTMIQAFAGGNITTKNPLIQEISKKENIDFQVNELNKKFLDSNTNKEDNFKKKDSNISTSDTENVIASNIQTVSNILSSSPSELAEQARSYTLGKFNSVVSSEAQKWLSQFGTVRINFGLDTKGTLENNSFDLLLPFYDNKTDWLLFSQFGYRNKDSRNTINVGLGGRYFYQNWMYGLNTFYDHDLTGKNQRLGLGGEIWGDYIKLSANTYWRLSDWQKSKSFKDYQERPANGYDINGEFFLPAYPNLGAKLTYEKYFGDNVTLFNRDTKQKNPSLAKLGLTYTPIPLFTIGVDYKQGERGYTETQFLANLDYKLGVPLSVQLSPENVAPMRTLAGSRYDLIERNHNIVLEHQKRPIAQLSLPETIIGYSREQHDIIAKLSSDTSVKQIHWTTSKDFESHGGKLSSNVGNTIRITLPKYLSDKNQSNNYPIYAFAELENNQKLSPVEMRVIVRPFMVKKREEASFTPAGPLPATGNKQDGYTFNPIITFDTSNGAPIKNTIIHHAQWMTDPKTGPDSGLQFIDWEKLDDIEIDGNGHFKHKPILISSKPHKNVKVYLQLDNQPQQLVGEVRFDENIVNFKIDKIEILPQAPSLVANGTQAYTYTAIILDGDQSAKNKKITNVKWSITRNGQDETDNKQLILNPKGDTTGRDGELTATLASKEALDNLQVSLSIENHSPVHAEQLVSFYADPKNYQVKDIHVDQKGPLTADGIQKYTYTAVITDGNGNKLGNTKISNVSWSTNKESVKELILTKENETTGSSDGKLIAYLTSKKEVNDVLVSLSIEGHAPVWIDPTHAVSFNPERISQIEVSPTTPILVNKTYTLKIKVTDDTSTAESGQKVKWSIKDTSQQGLTFNPAISTVGTDGKATTTLTSTQVQNVTVVASVDGIETKEADVVFAWPTIKKPTFTPASGNVTADADKHPNNAYHYTAHVYDADGKTPYTEKDIKFKWRLKPLANGNAPQNTWLSEKGEVTTEPDGTLKVNLMSSQLNPVMTDVVVCLAVVGKNSIEIPSTEQCADPVSFVKPVEDLKIEGDLEVTFDPHKPIIMGGSVEPYIYTAKVVKANDTALPEGYKVDATWTTDQTAGIYNGKPEWVIISDNTVKNGLITAKLSSQVGIGDIKGSQVTNGLTVKLTVPAGKGKTDFRKAKQEVAFDTPTKTAGLHLFNDKNKTGRIFKEQNGPYNTFQNMKAELVDLLTGKPIVQSHDHMTYSSIPAGLFDYFASFDSNQPGVFSFYASNKLKLTMAVTKSNKAKYIYAYNFNTKRYFYGLNQGVTTTIDNNYSCDTTSGNILNLIKTMTEDDLVNAPMNDIPLTKEFEDLINWGMVENSARIVGTGVHKGLIANFVYDIKEKQVVYGNHNMKGYFMCVYHAPK